MGISPYNSYNNFSQNNISDASYELRRQLETRKSQLDKLNSKEVLSQDQINRKKDLEQTVSLLQNKLDKRLGKSSDSNINSQSDSKQNKPNAMTFPEGSVISKNAYPKTQYYSAKNEPDNTYLKGFFFDTRI